MSRRPRSEEARLWALVAATVRPFPGRVAEIPPEAAPSTPAKPRPPPPAAKAPAPFVPAAHQSRPRVAPKPPPNPQPGDIEPGRKRRLTRERDSLELVLDLHGLDQDRARTVLHRFLQRAQEDGARAVLVITGKGVQGDGVLRRRAPEWLAEPMVRGVVAGVSEAHRRHGGAGALYVALKRKAG
ncbi:MAG TPA: Smr/MutS family protein [Caulobacteraceae bacterium]|jgi:DNA-nicking Smr family endonuclease